MQIVDIDIRTGITGNSYVYGTNKDAIINIAIEIKKSPNSIYFSDKFGMWVLRIKSKSHKNKLKLLNHVRTGNV